MSLIILLNRNTLDYTRACLKTLLAQTVPVEILAVNNASNDGTSSFLRSQQKLHGIYLMSLGEVQSVSHCWNRALTWGWKNKVNSSRSMACASWPSRTMSA